MQQQINLYQPVARGPQGTLSSATVVRLLALVVLVLAGIWGFSEWEVLKLRKGVGTVRAQHQAQEQIRAAGLSDLEALSQEALDARVTSLSAALEGKTRALAQLRSETTARNASFAARLEGLARQHVDGVWLDHLTLGGSANAMSLSGTTVSPTLVPQYLHNLAADPALRGAQIDEFVIEQRSSKNAQAASGLRFRASNQELAPRSAEELKTTEEQT
jgi:type IV pilus assembly PilN-like protein